MFGACKVWPAALSRNFFFFLRRLQQLCHCQNPYIDIDDGAGTTTAFADHPFQKLSSNIGKFGLIHIGGPSTQVSIHDCCCRGANSCCRDANSQLGKAMNSMASSFRAAKSTQFVYTPSNASSMRAPNFKLELIKVRNRMFGLQSEV